MVKKIHKIIITTMNHSARPIVTPIVNIFLEVRTDGQMKVRTEVRTDDMCENNDHHRP